MCAHRCAWWMNYVGVNANEYAFLAGCVWISVCVPEYLCSQSLICSCSVAALFQVSQQPGEYLLAEPWANYLYSYLCIFLLCVSVGAFVFVPLWLSPSLSGSVPYLHVVAWRWGDGFASGCLYTVFLSLSLFLFFFFLSHIVSNRVVVHLSFCFLSFFWGVCYSYSKAVYLLLYMCVPVILSVFLYLWKLELSLALNNCFFPLLVHLCLSTLSACFSW